MSNKYLELVKIIQKSRENIKPALQGNIFEREMLESDVLRGEEAKMRALEEIEQRPEIKITDEDKSTPIEADDEEEEEEEEEEVKQEEKGELTEEELQDKLENHSLDISKRKLTPKNSVKAMRQSGRGKKYYLIRTDSRGKNEQIVIYTKQSKMGKVADPDGIDELLLTLPLIRGKIPFDVGEKNLKLFTSLLRKGDVKNELQEQIGAYFKPVKAGRGHDPRLLLGSYLAKNNNKQLKNLVRNML